MISDPLQADSGPQVTLIDAQAPPIFKMAGYQENFTFSLFFHLHRQHENRLDIYKRNPLRGWPVDLAKTQIAGGLRLRRFFGFSTEFGGPLGRDARTGDAVPAPGPQTRRIAFGNPTRHFPAFCPQHGNRRIGRLKTRSTVQGQKGSAPSTRACLTLCSLILMLLAPCGKCRGLGGSAPKPRQVGDKRIDHVSLARSVPPSSEFRDGPFLRRRRRSMVLRRHFRVEEGGACRYDDPSGWSPP